VFEDADTTGSVVVVTSCDVSLEVLFVVAALDTMR